MGGPWNVNRLVHAQPMRFVRFARVQQRAHEQQKDYTLHYRLISELIMDAVNRRLWETVSFFLSSSMSHNFENRKLLELVSGTHGQNGAEYDKVILEILPLYSGLWFHINSCIPNNFHQLQ